MYQLHLHAGGHNSYLRTLEDEYRKLIAEIENSTKLTAEEKKAALEVLASKYNKAEEQSAYSLF